MTDTVEALLRDMLAWLEVGERPYAEVMDAWRTSCPRLPVWEEANDRGLVAQHRTARGAVVGLTQAGRDFMSGRAA